MFGSLLSSGTVYFDAEGYGIDRQVFTDDNPIDDPRRRRVEVYIDIGPKEWLDRTRRVQDGDIIFGPLFVKGKDADALTPEPYIPGPRKECDCYVMNYQFTTQKEADFAKLVIETFAKDNFEYKDKLSVATEIDANGKSIYTLRSECMPSRNEVNQIAVASRYATNKAANFLKALWPQTSEDCKIYTISFGAFKNQENSERLRNFLNAKNIPDVRVETADKNGTTFYRIRSGHYKNTQEAESYARKFSSILRKSGFKTNIQVLKEELVVN